MNSIMVYFWANGDVYEGQWLNGTMNGQGEFRMADGSVYKGGYKNGKKNGNGTLIDKDGIRFVGFFTDDFKDGPYEEFAADGTLLHKGVYQRNQLKQLDGKEVASAPEIKDIPARVANASNKSTYTRKRSTRRRRTRRR